MISKFSLLKILDFSEPECNKIFFLSPSLSFLTLHFFQQTKNKNHHSDNKKQKSCKSMLHINFEDDFISERKKFLAL